MTYFALVYYPEIEDPSFQSLRRKFEPFADLLPEHLTLIFPLPDSIGRDRLVHHIHSILRSWSPFPIHLCRLQDTWDHWLFLVPEEGYREVVALHDQLYTGILADHLREDLPFLPHVALGYFGREDYDPEDPAAKRRPDEKKRDRIRKAFEALQPDLWRTVDQLTLVQLAEDLSECKDLQRFALPA